MDVTPSKNHLFTFCESRSRLVAIAKLGQALWSTPRTCLPTRHSLQWRFASVLCPTAVRNFLCFGAVDLFIGPCCRPIFYYAISVVIGGLHGLLTCNYLPRGVVFVCSVAEKGHMPPPIHPADRQDIVPEE